MLSIIIPAYNEEETLIDVINNIFKSLKSIKFEIIIVDDGSYDKTLQIANKIAKKYSNIKVIIHKKNMGKSAAVLTGIKSSKGKIIIIQDADAEYNPKDIPSLIKPIVEKKADVVYGSRFLGRIDRMNISHKFGNKFLTFITKLLYSIQITDMETGYKAVKSEIIKNISLKENNFGFEPELTAKLANKKIRILELPITYNERKKGIKKITWKDGIKAFFILLKYKFLK